MISPELAEWTRANQRLVEALFGESLPSTGDPRQDRDDIQRYFEVIRTAYLAANQRRRHLLAHSTIQNHIAEYFSLLGWECGIEVPFADLDVNYRFDVMARLGARSIVVEVKPEATTKDLGQVLGYVFGVQAKVGAAARVVLGTDLTNLHIVCGKSEVADMIRCHAKGHGLGLFLVDTQAMFLLPSQMLLLRDCNA